MTSPRSTPGQRTLLLTGGSGFFGKSVLDAFRRGVLDPFRLDRIIVLSRHATRLRQTAPELCGPAVELVDEDVLRLASTREADIVVHAAASADAASYDADPCAEARIIQDGTARVLEAAARSSRRPRVVHVSSGAVYGPQPAGVDALAEDAPQQAALDPAKAAYASAKRIAERTAAGFAADGRVSVTVARCFAFVGAYLPLDRHFAIGNFLQNALRREPIVVRAAHPVIRTYLHADDLAVWLMRLGTAATRGYDVFNVGSDEAVSLRDVAQTVGRIAGVPVTLPAAVEGSGAGGAASADRYVPDISKARRELGLSVTIPLDEAIRKTLRALSGSGTVPV